MRFFLLFKAQPRAAHPAASDFQRLSLIRFPLIVLIVCCHADRGAAFSSQLHGSPTALAIVDALVNGLSGIRVPTFFLIAGYVFFRSVKPTPDWFENKIRSRARSLLLPLLLWNGIALLGLALVQQMPAAAAALSGRAAWGTPVSQFSLVQWLDALVGGTAAQPLVYPLWFLRDLFLLVLLTPAIYHAIRVSGGWVGVIVFVCWALAVDPHWVAGDAFFFFFVGCFVAITARSLFHFDALGLPAAAAWLVLQALHTVGAADGAGKLETVLGVLAVLALSGRLLRSVAAPCLSRSARYSFFLFVAHEPLLTVVRAVVLKCFQPATASQLLLGYALTVLAVVIGLIAVFEWAGQRAPRLLNLATGGRTPAAPPRRDPPVAPGVAVRLEG